MSSTEPILFYGHRNEWGEFSNFYPSPFELDGHTWPTVEHYFVAMKSEDPDFQDRARKVESPGQVKKLGRDRSLCKLRPKWDTVKIRYMERAVQAKFEQNPDLKDVLLSTGDRLLHENCRDPWWGGGPNYPKGRDLLGKILRRVRISLQENSA